MCWLSVACVRALFVGCALVNWLCVLVVCDLMVTRWLCWLACCLCARCLCVRWLRVGCVWGARWLRVGARWLRTIPFAK